MKTLLHYIDPERIYQQIFSSSLIKKITFFSPSLGIDKSFYVYFPKAYQNLKQRFPVIYLLRGHESEWINKNQDSTRRGKNIKDVMDDLISSGKINPALVIMPGLSSDDNHIPGLGVNFADVSLTRGKPGIGTGRFEDFFINDLIPYIDKRFRTLADQSNRSIDGFSVGGYAAVMLGLKHPELFTSVGSFDGTHQWKDFDDPRQDQPIDKTWMENEMFAPAFGRPFQHKYALQYNSTELLDHVRLSPEKYKHLKFSITCVNKEPDGNRDRTLHLLKHLRKAGFTNQLDSYILNPKAEHTWFWADEYVRRTIPIHLNSVK